MTETYKGVCEICHQEWEGEIALEVKPLQPTDEPPVMACPDCSYEACLAVIKAHNLEGQVAQVLEAMTYGGESIIDPQGGSC